jgi:hypothetical protein
VNDGAQEPSITTPVETPNDLKDDDASTTGGEEPPDAPQGMLTEDPIIQLTSRMFTTLSPKHISSFSFSFKGSFRSSKPNAKSSFAHKSASITFTRNNIIKEKGDKGNIVKSIKPTDEVFTKRVALEQVTLAQHQLGLEQ